MFSTLAFRELRSVVTKVFRMSTFILQSFITSAFCAYPGGVLVVVYAATFCSSRLPSVGIASPPTLVGSIIIPSRHFTPFAIRSLRHSTRVRLGLARRSALRHRQTVRSSDQVYQNRSDVVTSFEYSSGERPPACSLSAVHSNTSVFQVLRQATCIDIVSGHSHVHQASSRIGSQPARSAIFFNFLHSRAPICR